MVREGWCILVYLNVSAVVCVCVCTMRVVYRVLYRVRRAASAAATLDRDDVLCRMRWGACLTKVERCTRTSRSTVPRAHPLVGGQRPLNFGQGGARASCRGKPRPRRYLHHYATEATPWVLMHQGVGRLETVIFLEGL